MLVSLLVDIPDYGIIIAVILASVGATAGYFKKQASIATQINDLKVKVDVIWSVFRNRFAEVLKLPIHRRMDDLLEKTKTQRLTDLEAIELKTYLIDMMDSGRINPKSIEAMAYDYYIQNIDRQLNKSKDENLLPKFKFWAVHK